MKYILTIDDDEALCKLVKKCIETAQVPVYTFLRGEDALSFFYQNQSDCVLVILDIMLPGMDGYSVLEKVRAVSNVPVLMLTAKDQEEDKVAGLQNGADDYLTKPFGLAELTARVNSLVRRYTKFNPHHEENQRLRFHDMTIDPSAHSVEVQGKLVSLTENLTFSSFWPSTRDVSLPNSKSIRISGKSLITRMTAILCRSSASCAKRLSLIPSTLFMY